MALEKEIWINSVIEGMFADNTFAARSIDHSIWANDRTVHVPNAGTPPNVEKNRATLPATMSQRTDADLTYTMAEFTTDPIRLSHAEQVELSYNKRESIIRVSRAALSEKVHNYILGEWITGAAAITAEPTVRDTILKIKKQMDKDDVLQVGRCLLLESDTYNDLLKELSDVQAANFLSGADPIKGIVAKYYGFDIYTRSKLDGTQKGLAWQDNSVCRALGDTVMFDQEGDPTLYSDVVSFLVRAGGTVVRSDSKGALKF